MTKNKRPAYEEAADRFLEQQGYQSFPSYFWNIKQEEGRKRAAKWLAAQVRAVLKENRKK